jgi:SAM-dependent methyltransferase
MAAPHDLATAIRAYYEQGGEEARLGRSAGIVEFERTKEILLRHLPPAPARILDVGGGPGRYAVWLASLGYAVELRDLMPLHVEQATAAADAAGVRIEAELGDARQLDLEDGSVDAALLLGPLYHLDERADRVASLAEARRLVRPGGIVFAAAISRWAPRLDGAVSKALYRIRPGMRAEIPPLEATGRLPPLVDGGFAGYCHRPQELRDEVVAAGLECLDLVSVEGIAFALPDLDERLADETDRAVIFDAARAIERVPELLGLGPHLLATARRP